MPLINSRMSTATLNNCFCPPTSRRCYFCLGGCQVLMDNAVLTAICSSDATAAVTAMAPVLTSAGSRFPGLRTASTVAAAPAAAQSQL
jgi:hypothetical protein